MTESLQRGSLSESSSLPPLCLRKEDCCGCGACLSICPVAAISMSSDSEGFRYPVVDAQKCVGCRKCLSVCAFKRDGARPAAASAPDDGNTSRIVPPLVYGGRLKDRSALLASSSGGAFTALSEVFLQAGQGVACSHYDYETRRQVFSVVTSPAERDCARGSKYVQAFSENIFGEAERFLSANPEKRLLFVGMGCQAAAFAAFAELRGFRSRVSIVDIVCHGVASPGIWEEYAQTLERRLGGKTEFLTFKDKRKGWLSPTAMAAGNGKEIPIADYVALFYSRKILRPSCHVCPYAALDRPSDITIGDFWGIHKRLPARYDKAGTSLFLVHTEEGEKLFSAAQKALEWFPSDLRSCRQPNLGKPTAPSCSRSRFWKEHRQKGFGYVLRKYGVPSLKTRFRKRIRGLAKCLLSLLAARPGRHSSSKASVHR